MLLNSTKIHRYMCITVKSGHNPFQNKISGFSSKYFFVNFRVQNLLFCFTRQEADVAEEQPESVADSQIVETESKSRSKSKERKLSRDSKSSRKDSHRSRSRSKVCWFTVQRKNRVYSQKGRKTQKLKECIGFLLSVSNIFLQVGYLKNCLT